jgi:hypothetical protein
MLRISGPVNRYAITVAKNKSDYFDKCYTLYLSQIAVHTAVDKNT